ncbi:MAG: ORF6N domain-containing protein [Bacteroidota bacterium]
MEAIITTTDIQDLILILRDKRVIVDSDIANLYGVETRDINKAVKNNPNKFPNGYIFEITTEELEDLRWKFSTTKLSKTRVLPKAFTEKGLYMLATILKSSSATQTTIAIIETFSKIKELSRHVKELQTMVDKDEQQNLMRRSGELITEILDDDLKISDTETSIEFNFAVVKFKHTIKKKK